MENNEYFDALTSRTPEDIEAEEARAILLRHGGVATDFFNRFIERNLKTGRLGFIDGVLPTPEEADKFVPHLAGLENSGVEKLDIHGGVNRDEIAKFALALEVLASIE